MSTQKLISTETIDNIHSSLAKAIAITQLLSTDGQSIDGFQSQHSVVMDAIWVICDQLDNIKNELRGK
ncbi:MAG: hypothetical protein [Bacteriophage sp.]|nr:MAG: hypothetical protein [Bacteriophage sp.]